MHGLKLFSVAAAALVAIALLSSVAGAANRGAAIVDATPAGLSPNADADAAGVHAMPEAELPAEASEVAVESAAEGLATANAAIATAGERAADREESNANENSPVLPAPAQAAKVRPTVAGPPQTLPGWGCGDPNRTHSGPPGRVEEPAPQGCDR
jgi:hypothetical protein